MSYAVKEIFLSLQGEGARTGAAAVFCRFAGCNLWSGREEDRADAVCHFCDTEFVGTDGKGGDRFADAEALAGAIADTWRGGARGRLVIFTGGEPLLQLDAALLHAMKERGFTCALETNSTLPVPEGLDWICVSPKAGAPLQQTSGNELKLVFPQAGLDPKQLERLDFGHFFVQPMDGPCREANTVAAIAFCLENPRWRLSLQTHKLIGIE
jgi:7-carboxy-7-deazaguanine synthase (Cx14CxxC type)